MSEPDLIVDILQRIREKADVSEDVAKAVERDARQYWGGERCYVAKAGESPIRREAADRAERIRADHKRGEHVPLLARRYDLTERRIRQILGLIEATPAANEPTRRRPLPVRQSRHRKPPAPQD
jgi:Mor family transcriptional regulator